MKTKSAFTLIELLVVISILAILAGMLLPLIAKISGQSPTNSNRKNNSQEYHQTYSKFSVGDSVVLEISDTTSITGKVSDVYLSGKVDILAVGTNGTLSTISSISPSLLRKINKSERSW